MLRADLGFYLCCLNLRDRLMAKDEPPTPASLVLAAGDRACLSASGLYDASLALSLDTRAVGNDVKADGCLVMARPVGVFWMSVPGHVPAGIGHFFACIKNWSRAKGRMPAAGRIAPSPSW